MKIILNMALTLIIILLQYGYYYPLYERVYIMSLKIRYGKMKIDSFIQSCKEDNPYSDQNYPTYYSQLINLAGQNSKATSPKNVGQMTEIYRDYSLSVGKKCCLETWKHFYDDKMPGCYEKAVEKIKRMCEKMPLNSDILMYVDKFVYELLYIKTPIGLGINDFLLQYIANLNDLKLKLSSPEEEAKGIDGFIGKTPFSVKPHTYTYNTMNKNIENIQCQFIFYEKCKDKNGNEKKELKWKIV